MGKPRMNFTVPPKLNKRLNTYCVEIAKRNGKIPHGIYSKIGLMALEEWLDKHEKDFTLKFED